MEVDKLTKNYSQATSDFVTNLATVCVILFAIAVIGGLIASVRESAKEPPIPQISEDL